MKLYLLRHGPAAPRDPHKYPRDVARPLTPAGRKRLRNAVIGMKALGLRFDHVLTSPLTRARQTARIVVVEMNLSPGSKVLRALAPGGTSQEVLDGIAHARAENNLLLVGHEPGLSRLAADLISRSGANIALELKKGGLCLVEFDDEVRPGAGRLVFLMPPKVLRLLS